MARNGKGGRFIYGRECCRRASQRKFFPFVPQGFGSLLRMTCPGYRISRRKQDTPRSQDRHQALSLRGWPISSCAKIYEDVRPCVHTRRSHENSQSTLHLPSRGPDLWIGGLVDHCATSASMGYKSCWGGYF